MPDAAAAPVSRFLERKSSSFLFSASLTLVLMPILCFSSSAISVDFHEEPIIDANALKDGFTPLLIITLRIEEAHRLYIAT